MFSNPVSLSAISNWSAASYYTSLYEIKELGVAAVAGSKRMGNWAIGLGASRFGLKQFNQKTFVLGISVRPTPPFYCGVTIKYYTVDIERYSGSSSFLFDAGWKYVVGPIVQISGAIRNFTRATNGGPNEPLPQSYQAGIQLLFENRISLFSEVFKEVDFVPEIRFGAEIDVSRFFKVRIGMTRTPSRFTGGFSLRALGIKIEYGVSHHGILGYTHAFGMILTG